MGMNVRTGRLNSLLVETNALIVSTRARKHATMDDLAMIGLVI